MADTHADIFPSPALRDVSAARTVGGVFITAILLTCSLNNVTHLVPIGPTNLNVVLTAVTVPVSFALVVIHGRLARTGLGPIILYMMFCAYTVGYLLYSAHNLQSYQNTTMYLAIGGVALLSFQLASTNRNWADLVIRGLKTMAWLSALLYLASLVSGLGGLNSIYSARSFAVLAVAACAVYVAEARAGERFAALKSVLFCVLCLLTVSRTASACAMIVLAALWLDVRRIRSWIVTLVTVALVIVAYIYLSTHVAQFRTSFFGGDEALRIGSFAIDSKGRIFWWTLLWESFLEAPIFGHGPGGFQTQLFLDVQPHNDHLRLLHDLGIVGYILWWAGICGALLMIFRGWRMAAGPYDQEAVLMMSSFLFMGAFITVMITDNVLVYFPLAIPFAVLLGSGLGVAGRRIAEHRRVRLGLAA